MKRKTILEEMGIGPIWRLRRSSVDDAVLPEEKTPCDAGHIDEGSWQALNEAIADCRQCALCERRNRVVPGVGDPKPQWLFVGEGPGEEEDAKGEPFVGQAGRLFDNQLSAIGLKRGQGVYIANVVKCRPPGNRAPHTDEIAACMPFLERQIALLQPRLIVALGATAALALLGEKHSIASLRKKRFEYKGIPLTITYHPAYLLRNLPDKSKAWEDLCFARTALECSGKM